MTLQGSPSLKGLVLVEITPTPVVMYELNSHRLSPTHKEIIQAGIMFLQGFRVKRKRAALPKSTVETCIMGIFLSGRKSLHGTFLGFRVTLLELEGTFFLGYLSTINTWEQIHKRMGKQMNYVVLPRPNSGVMGMP